MTDYNADYPCSTYTGAPGETRMQSELAAAFKRVAPKDHWKNPIDVTLDAKDVDVRLIIDAVVHFTGSVPEFIWRGGFVRIRAAGYFATIGA